jgi:hypothetical protein
MSINNTYTPSVSDCFGYHPLEGSRLAKLYGVYKTATSEERGFKEGMHDFNGYGTIPLVCFGSGAMRIHQAHSLFSSQFGNQVPRSVSYTLIARGVAEFLHLGLLLALVDLVCTVVRMIFVKREKAAERAATTPPIQYNINQNNSFSLNTTPVIEQTT